MKANGKPTSRAPPRPFPQFSLEETIAVSRAIQDSNAGRPMNRLLLADAIKRKPSSSEFRDLLSSSFKYGLTTGTEKAVEIQLTELGKRVTKPISEEDRASALKTAALSPELFRRVFEHYENSKLPSGEFFNNTLERQFAVPAAHAQECQEMIERNGEFARLIVPISGSPHILIGQSDERVLSEGSPASDQAPELPRVEAESDLVESEKHGDEVRNPLKPGQIFIGHGKNIVPLNQIKKILDELRVPYKVAIEEANAGRPISEKVATTMHECTSGIFIFTGDERVFDEKGAPVLRPSENVVFELGAGSTMFGNRIVIFKEEGVSFPTDFRDIGYIPFESQKLDAKATELIRELVGFGILKISAA